MGLCILRKCTLRFEDNTLGHVFVAVIVFATRQCAALASTLITPKDSPERRKPMGNEKKKETCARSLLIASFRTYSGFFTIYFEYLLLSWLFLLTFREDLHFRKPTANAQSLASFCTYSGFTIYLLLSFMYFVVVNLVNLARGPMLWKPSTWNQRKAGVSGGKMA